MTDEELTRMLQKWQAPPAPETLRARVFRRRSRSFAWLLFGEVRLPVPVAVAALCFLLYVAYQMTRPSVATLSDFQQVRDLQPRIVRTVNETR